MANILILGAGNVGSTIAFRLAIHPLIKRIYLYDINEEKCEAQVSDLSDALFHCHFERWKGQKVEIVINCTGSAQILQTGNRDNELKQARKNVETITRLISKDFDGFFVNVANPCDKVTAMLGRTLSLSKERLFGTGTMLDTIRLNHQAKGEKFIVVGEHGDENIILTESPEVLSHVDEMRKKAWKIISQKGCTNFGIAGVVYAIICTILGNKKKEMTLCVCHENGKWYSDRCILSAKGIEKVITPSMTKEHKKRLKEIIRQINNC